MLQRWRFVESMMWTLNAVIPDLWRGGEKVDAAWAQNVVDIIAIRLTGRVLGARSNRAAVAYVSKLPGTRARAAMPAAVFIARMPEVQQR